MKKLRVLCAAALLVFVVSLSAYAGDITTMGPTPSPAVGRDMTTGVLSPAPNSDTPAAPSDVQIQDAPTDVIDIVLSLFQLLSVF